MIISALKFLSYRVRALGYDKGGALHAFVDAGRHMTRHTYDYVLTDGVCNSEVAEEVPSDSTKPTVGLQLRGFPPHMYVHL